MGQRGEVIELEELAAALLDVVLNALVAKALDVLVELLVRRLRQQKGPRRVPKHLRRP